MKNKKKTVTIIAIIGIGLAIIGGKVINWKFELRFIRSIVLSKF